MQKISKLAKGACLIYKFVYLQVKNLCPLCKTGHLSEDYSGAVRGSSKGVIHKCGQCNKEFKDGVLHHT